MKIDGGCQCGNIAYTAEIDPATVSICHCTDCQTFSGSAFRLSAPVTVGTLEIASGEVKTYVKTAESGAKRAQGFCPECDYYDPTECSDTATQCPQVRTECPARPTGLRPKSQRRAVR